MHPSRGSHRDDDHRDDQGRQEHPEGPLEAGPPAGVAREECHQPGLTLGEESAPVGTLHHQARGALSLTQVGQPFYCGFSRRSRKSYCAGAF